MRTFIAISFEPATIKQIKEITNYFKSKTPGYAIKWVDPDNMHLTIKFIGELAEEKLEGIKRAIRESLANQSEFEISVEGLGMFPNKQKPRAIWLGITNGQSLAAIHSALDLALQAFDVEREHRKFSPHLTIARVRRNVDHDTAAEIGETLSQFNVSSLGKNKIREVTLYKSELTPKGSIYSPLLSVPLNKV